MCLSLKKNESQNILWCHKGAKQVFFLYTFQILNAKPQWNSQLCKSIHQFVCVRSSAPTK